MKPTTKLLVVAASIAGTVGLATAGWAYWTSRGSGAAAATVGTLNAPTGISATQPDSGISTVHVTWTASVATPTAVAPAGYVVKRDAADACNTSLAAPTTLTSCDDTNVSNGSHTYTVTAIFGGGSWTAASGSSSITVHRAPAITSANSATFTVGSAGSFTVTASGSPAPTFSKTGALPSGVTLDASTGVLSGTPAAGTGGVYPITITATNSIGTPATQSFTLTVNQAPAITSATAATFTVGSPGTFTVTATGTPTPTLSESGALPSGVTFNASTGVLSGTPTAAASSPITFTATNGVGTNATQSFTLTVNQAPAITSANSTTFTVGTAGSFPVTATGTPTPTLSESGALPSGVTFNASTGVLSGTPTATGSSAITFTAANGVGSNATQNFTLTVNQATTTTSLSLAPASVVYGNETAETFTATVTPQFSGSPTGTVAVKNGATTLCTITLPATTCSLTATQLSASGTAYSITATYNGDANFTGSTSTAKTFTVNKATPTITWATPTAITYGTALSGTQLNATASVPGTLSYNPASGTVLTAGSQSLGVTFSPTDTTDYTGNTATVTLTVNKATPTITWATPTAITYGTALSGTQLNATASVPGTLTYNPASGTTLTAGSQSLGVTFSPTDTTDYTGNTATVTLTVNKATPTITVAASPVAPTLGQLVTFTATVTGPTNAAAPAGAVTWAFGTSPVTSCASTTALSGSTNVATATCTITASKAGGYSVTGSVATDTNYNAAGPSTPATFTVSKATPTITVAANPTAPTLGQSVVFTATVTGAANAATPTGTVTWAFGTSPVTSCASTTALSGSTNVATATCTITASKAGGYSVTGSVATDTNYNAAGPSTPATFSVAGSPTITAVSISNKTGGTASTPESGDTIVFTYSNGLKMTSICSTSTLANTASGSITPTASSTTVKLTKQSGATPILFTSTDCTLHLGSISLPGVYVGGSNGATLTFAGSSVAWNGSNTITVTLGSTVVGTTATGSTSTPNTFTPDTAVTDPANNAISGTAFTWTGANF